MSNSLSNASFKHNSEEQQYELHLDDQIAVIEYLEQDGKIDLVHTEVPKELGGRGVGTELVKRTLEALQKNNASIKASCPFVAKYIDQHPEYASMLSTGYQM